MEVASHIEKVSGQMDVLMMYVTADQPELVQQPRGRHALPQDQPEAIESVEGYIP
jgi:hypothetical protein